MSETEKRPGVILVAGAGGFIGGHLVGRLLDAGANVRAVDAKPLDEWHQTFGQADSMTLDLSGREACVDAIRGVSEVYNLAANMGGIGFIENFKADCMLSVLINTHLLMAARDEGVERYLFSSSACVYAADKQSEADVVALTEKDAYPALAEDGYGWEKLFSERMCRHFREDYGLETRVARYHNVYGPHGTYDGGREKAPAAICRKVATAVLTGDHEIEIWGDGEQTRSFMYIDDCIEGSLKIGRGDFAEPLNLGSSELVTINQMVDLAEEIAGVRLERRYKLDAPQGVRGRNSDNTLIRGEFGWEPGISLREGLEQTYAWVHDQLARPTRRPRGRPGKSATDRPVTRRPPAVIHVTHYKAGSQWIHAILRNCLPSKRIIRPQFNRGQFLEDRVRPGKVYPTVYVTRDEWETATLPPDWRRFVVIRDLRDALISAYFSVKISHPKFKSAPTLRLRDELQDLSVEDGLMLVIQRWLPNNARIQGSWVAAGEPVIRYEDLLERDVEILEPLLLEHCELRVPKRRLHRAIVQSRFDRLSGGRARGQEDIASHQRKGVAGDWRNHFTDELKAAFNEKAGDVLVAAGYEDSLDW